MLDLNAIPVTIAAGGTVSSTGNLGVQALVGIVLPSNWTAAAMTFTASAINDGVNFYSLVDQSGTAVRMPSSGTFSGGTFIAVSNYAQFAAVNMVKVVSSATQTNTVTIQLLVRNLGF